MALVLPLCFLPGVARADAVDERFAEGNAAAQRGDWVGAVAAYEAAAALLPGTSDLLEYDLGTAHAHLGKLGPATYHLQRALRNTRDPALREAARRNLGVVRREAELQAATSETRISPPPGWRERLWRLLGSPIVGLAGIALGWATVAMVALRQGLVRREVGASAVMVLGPLALTSALAFVLLSAAHGLALRAEPEAVVLPDQLEVLEGPGRHRAVAFRLQGGSSVRVVAEAPGWQQVRLGGGLTGWVPHGSLGPVDGPRGPSGVASRGAPSSTSRGATP